MNTSRREFLALTGLAAQAAWNGVAEAKPLGMPIGMQPYTVRNELAKDLEGTLKQVAKMGYEAIEAGAPFYGKQPAETRSLLKSLGLISPSGGFGNPMDDAGWARSIENAKALGATYMIVTAPTEWTKSLDGWKRAAERFNKLGEQAKKAGTAVVYHNHNWEYKIFDGVMAYDELLRSTDPALVNMEMDVFWTTVAGRDPVEYFDRYPGRFPLWHIKDLKRGFPPTTDRVTGNPFGEIGTGIIDWKRIFQAAPKAGVKYYYVEQDQTDRTPLESARMSCDFLKKFSV
jgi:sugar phosphate isomerase/epimerase